MDKKELKVHQQFHKAIDAVRRVWEVDGVQEVINEIQIGNRATLKEYANDLWINTLVKGLAITGKTYIERMRAKQIKENEFWDVK